MNRIIRRLMSGICLLMGILLLFYPWISEFLYEKSVGATVTAYEAQVAERDALDQQQMLEQARAYNARIAAARVTLADPFVEDTQEQVTLDYDELLTFDETGIMGYVEIPKIDQLLPIYHGTGDGVLEQGIGHLKGTSLPVGGMDSNVVLCGHTGMNQAKLFTDLELMELDDVFFLKVMDQKLAYQVVDIQVVEPEDSSLLQIQSGRELCTLVTCTPYGINSHRLLVIGERTDYVEEAHKEDMKQELRDRRKSNWMKHYRSAILLGLLLLAGLFLFLYPIMRRVVFRSQAQQCTEQALNPDSEDVPIENGKDEWWERLIQYNQNLYASGQAGMQGSEDFEDMPFYWNRNDTESFGVIEIPEMDLSMPLFLGSSTEHLAAGAAVLGQTSVPIGGLNTNAVIAGHRGYRGNPYFLYIENLKPGDAVYITNPWETLTYIVEDIQIIEPDDCNALYIQENRDMVTLMTCHPYMSNGRYRYLVHCIREEDWLEDQQDVTYSEKQEKEDAAGVVSDSEVAGLSSGQLILLEKVLWAGGAIAILCMIISMIRRGGIFP